MCGDCVCVCVCVGVVGRGLGKIQEGKELLVGSSYYEERCKNHKKNKDSFA